MTGASGYVGEMLCDQLAKRDDVRQIIGLDKEPQTEFGRTIPKMAFVKMNMADDGWQAEVAKYEPEVVVHTAWQIRELYGNREEQWRWNVDGSEKVFAFAFNQPSVKQLIYFSTASSYSARVDNQINHQFTEDEGFRSDAYSYAEEKKVVEDKLKAKYDQFKKEGKFSPQVTVLRPAAITGPRGRYMRIRFGLQSALQGNLKGGLVNRLITLLTSFVPATKGWVRQFVHEDDVNDLVMQLVFEETDWEYNVFNLTPDSPPVLPRDMAEAVGKKILPIQPWMARLAFCFFWYATRGRVPTCPHSWRFYSYPIVMSGKKLADFYSCQHTSLDAFRYTTGRYEQFVPESQLRPKN